MADIFIVRKMFCTNKKDIAKYCKYCGAKVSFPLLN